MFIRVGLRRQRHRRRRRKLNATANKLLEGPGFHYATHQTEVQVIAPIRYLGINVGQVESLSLSKDNNQVVAKAVLYPEYVNDFARLGSRFSVVH